MNDVITMNPFRIRGAPLWVLPVVFLLSLLVCWAAREQQLASNTWGLVFHPALWLGNGICLALLVGLLIEGIHVYGKSTSISDKSTISQDFLICTELMPEYRQVANPDQLLQCVDQARAQGTASHEKRWLTYASTIIPISAICYIIFLANLYQVTSNLRGSESILLLLLIPLVQCMLIVLATISISIWAKRVMQKKRESIRVQIAEQSKLGELAKRSPPPPNPPLHSVTLPQKPKSDVSEDPPNLFGSGGAAREVNDGQIDNPPNLFGTSSGSSSNEALASGGDPSVESERPQGPRRRRRI